MKERKAPNIFLIGAQKSATTSLATWLATHPNVYLPDRKEPFFFCRDKEFYKGKKYYVNRYYSNVSDNKWRMDASTSYMVSPKVPARINNFSNSRKKFIAILRHPVDRVQSAYTFRLNKHEYNDTRRMSEIFPNNIDSKSLNIDELLRWEKEKVREVDLSKREKSSWRGSGFPFRLFYVSAYSLHIERWLSVFERDDFLFLKFEDFVKKREKVAKKVGKFLDIEKKKINEEKEEDRNITTGYPPYLARSMQMLKSRLKEFIPISVQRKLLALEKILLNERPVSYEFDEETYIYLNKIFDEEIKRTSELTGLNLASWLSENISSKSRKTKEKNNHQSFTK